jgi:hypothetical protein
MTTVNKQLGTLTFKEFKAYIEQYPHITDDIEKLYIAAGGKLPDKKVKPKEEGE